MAVAADGSLGKLDSNKVLFWFEQQEQTEATWKASKVIYFSNIPYLMFPGSGIELTLSIGMGLIPQYGNETIPLVWE